MKSKVLLATISAFTGLAASAAAQQDIAQITVTGTVSQTSTTFVNSAYNSIQVGDPFSFTYAVDIDPVAVINLPSQIGAEYAHAASPINLNVGPVAESTDSVTAAGYAGAAYAGGSALALSPVTRNFGGGAAFSAGMYAEFELREDDIDVVQTYLLFENGSFTYSAWDVESLSMLAPAIGGGFTSVIATNCTLTVTTLARTSCTSNANSTGVPGVLTASGFSNAAANSLTLSVSDLPGNVFAQGLVSRNSGSGQVLEGLLCLGGNIGRYFTSGGLFLTDASGQGSFSPNLTQTPQGAGFVSIMPGETWYFQVFYRDVVGGVQTANLSSAVEILFQ